MLRRVSALVVAAILLVGCGGAQSPAKTTPASPAPQEKPAEAKPAPAQTQPTPAPSKPARKQWSAPPAMQIDPNKQYFATLKTEFGDIRIELFAKDAPNTVNNFVFLAREKFYDGVVFHRIIKGFMIQGGDPTGTGTGGPGYRFADELPVKRSYDPGIVAMANSGPNTQGSQFFICNGQSCRNLNGLPNYTQFGKVVAGMDVVEKISSVPVVAGGEATPSKPVKPPVIQTVVIEEK